MTGLRAVVVAGCSVGAVLAGIRWLRVAQREHYLPGTVTRFALRWWRVDPVNLVSLLIGSAGVALAWRWPVTGLATAVVVAGGPGGLGLKGRTSPLAWTRRTRTLGAVWVGLVGTGIALGTVAGAGPVVAAGVALGVPLLLDVACAITEPFERAVAQTYVTKATERLRRVGPTVVAITGSYGKTTTKRYLAHLLAGSKTVLASPASFNNRAGLARAVNENLLDGTDVFLAEMGTYGPGEIAELTSWIVPDIALITAIGPVHLERFGSEDRIVEAKAEILEKAPTVVLNVADPRLAALATTAEAAGQRVRRVSVCGPGPEESPGTPARDVETCPKEVDVCVREGPDGLTLFVDGAELARPASGGHPGNVASAVAVALELGVPVKEIAERVRTLPKVPHRLEPGTGAGGFLVLDDTYNSNPAGARAALGALRTLADPSGRTVVVTPGMVELGPVQAEENSTFARSVATVADDLLVVGRTNRRALLAGARTVGEGGRPSAHREGHREGDGGNRELRVVVVDHREEAVAWVRDHLGPGDSVLYENDLPDHYP